MNILITGGASGLGEAITKTLLKDRQNTIYFTYKKSEAKAKEIEAYFSNAIPIKCDFENAIELGLLIEKIKGINIDILINNAYNGESIKSHFHKIETADFLTDFEKNILPVVKITQACINLFRKKKKGKIITVLTSFLYNGQPIGSSIYVANKAYLASLVKSWTIENAKFGITSNSISPAFMSTNFTKDVDERVLEQMKENHPLKKILTVEEVADAVFFLVNSSSQINGIDIAINSGINI